MDERKRLKEELESEIKQTLEEAERHFERIGSYLASLPAENFSESTLADIHSKAVYLREQFPENERKIEIIRRSAERDKKIGMALKELEQAQEDIVRQNEDIYEQIGEMAFSTFIEDSSDDERLVGVFSELIEHDREIEEIGNEIDRVNAPDRDRPFLKKITNRGRMVYLKSRRGFLLRNLPGLYRKAGRAVCEIGLEDIINNISQPQVAKAFFENRLRWQDMDKQHAALQDERGELQIALADLEADKKPYRRVADLERANEKIEHSLQKAFAELGREYRDLSPSRIEIGVEVEDYLKKIASLERKTSRNAKHIERLEASLEIEKKRHRIAGMEGKIKLSGERIRKLQEEISLLQDEIDGTSEQVKKLEKVRGPVDSLLKK